MEDSHSVASGRDLKNTEFLQKSKLVGEGWVPILTELLSSAPACLIGVGPTLALATSGQIRTFQDS